MNQADIIVPIALQHTQTATCTLPWYVKHTEYHPLEATYEPLINGEEAFRAVHLAIAEGVGRKQVLTVREGSGYLPGLQ